MESTEHRSDRRRFLRRLGVTLAAGVGVLAVPGVAHAAYQCCLDNTHCSGVCPSGQFWHFCHCPDGTYCACMGGTGCVLAPC